MHPNNWSDILDFRHSAYTIDGPLSMIDDQPVRKSPAQPDLPVGVVQYPLAVRRGKTGATIDLFDGSQGVGAAAVQWNFVGSLPNTLRGVHVHPHHADYLCVLVGTMLLALHDMRPESASYRRSLILTLRGEHPVAMAIPPGVAHGFYFPEMTEYAYALDHYWTMAEEMGCRWNDPELGLSWRATDPLLSPRDRDAPSYAALVGELATALKDLGRA